MLRRSRNYSMLFLPQATQSMTHVTPSRRKESGRLPAAPEVKLRIPWWVQSNNTRPTCSWTPLRLFSHIVQKSVSGPLQESVMDPKTQLLFLHLDLVSDCSFIINYILWQKASDKNIYIENQTLVSLSNNVSRHGFPR